MSTDDLRAKLRDELSGFPIGTGYYQTTVGTNEAREMADALLPIIEAHTAAAVAEVRELIAGRLERLATKERSNLSADDTLWSHDDWADERGACCYDHAARIVRGQA